MVTGKYVGKSASELTALRTQFETARTNILTGHQSYTRPGLSVTRADLRLIMEELQEIEYAQRVESGNLMRETVAALDADI